MKKKKRNKIANVSEKTTCCSETLLNMKLSARCNHLTFNKRILRYGISRSRNDSNIFSEPSFTCARQRIVLTISSYTLLLIV